MFDEQISLGVSDYWERFQKPWITSAETAHHDAQVVRNAIDDLLTFNGWVAVRLLFFGGFFFSSVFTVNEA